MERKFTNMDIVSDKLTKNNAFVGIELETIFLNEEEKKEFENINDKFIEQENGDIDKYTSLIISKLKFFDKLLFYILLKNKTNKFGKYLTIYFHNKNKVNLVDALKFEYIKGVMSKYKNDSDWILKNYKNNKNRYPKKYNDEKEICYFVDSIKRIQEDAQKYSDEMSQGFKNNLRKYVKIYNVVYDVETGEAIDYYNNLQDDVKLLQNKVNIFLEENNLKTA